MSLLSILIYDIVYIESEGDNMKRNRNPFSYRARHFVWDINWKSVGSIIIDILAAIALFGLLFYGPHFFH
jgi:hypothetical protein